MAARASSMGMVANADVFQNDILVTGFDLPTKILFLPDGRMLVAELPGTIKILAPPYTTVEPQPFPLYYVDLGYSDVGGQFGVSKIRRIQYLPESSALSFICDRDFGQFRYYSYPFGPMPETFSTSPNSGITHWSFYGTLTP